MKFKGLIIGLLVACFSVPAFAQDNGKSQIPIQATGNATLNLDSSTVDNTTLNLDSSTVESKAYIKCTYNLLGKLECTVFNATADPLNIAIMIQAMKYTSNITVAPLGVEK